MPHAIDLPALATALLGFAASLVALLWRCVLNLWSCSGPEPESRPRTAGTLRRRLARLGPYLLEAQLGAGGMGEVYRARHVTSGEWCALKLLPRAASLRERERFRREARLSSQLSHPNTVAVYDYGQDADGTQYYAMELVEGTTLQQLVDQHGPQPERRVIDILLQLCDALNEVHGHGLVHRDVKPENVVVSHGADGDRVKLLDFGLAKQLGSPAGATANSVVGTPLYISPEAISAPGSVDGRSDLYGLGAVAYFLLAGKPVFPGNNVIEVCTHHLHTEPARLSQSAPGGVSPELERIVLDCLAKDPARRPASAPALAHRLRLAAAALFIEPSNDTAPLERSGVELLRSASHVRAVHRAGEARACA